LKGKKKHLPTINLAGVIVLFSGANLIINQWLIGGLGPGGLDSWDILMKGIEGVQYY